MINRDTVTHVNNEIAVINANEMPDGECRRTSAQNWCSSTRLTIWSATGEHVPIVELNDDGFTSTSGQVRSNPFTASVRPAVAQPERPR